MSEKKIPEPREMVIRVADRRKLEEEIVKHPMSATSEVRVFHLSRTTGLERLRARLLRIPPGKQALPLHVHWTEEEFVFVLSGRGVVEIADEVIDIAPGDFIGLPAGGHPHLVKNPGDEDLVLLSGGESTAVEVTDFPRDGRRLVRIGKEGAVHPLSLAEPFFPHG